MLSNLLTFIFFIVVGLEIREGLSKPKEVLLPALCALGGMVVPALIFIAFHTHTDLWAVAMPTDVALAIGALIFLGKRVNPRVRLFLLTLAVADDLFSLLVIAIFFRSQLHLSSAIYTLGAALIGAILPWRLVLIRYLSPVITFVVIPLYIVINLLAHLNFSLAFTKVSVALVIARIVGKVCGIFIVAAFLTRLTSMRLPEALTLKEIAGVGLLAGMGMTVSLVIAKITATTAQELNQVRIGLFITALVSGLVGLIWLRATSAQDS